MILTFVLEKETKGTYRYKENCGVGDPVFVGTLYVRKSGVLGLFLSETPPKMIQVEIKATGIGA